MKSPSAALNGRRLPRVRVVPRSVESDGDLATYMASGYGLTPDDWQEDVLDGWLGRRRNDRWASATCGLAVPRQNGKNGAIEVRELYGMVELGERFLHTAHEVKTARKAFLRISSFFENERKYPDLAAMVKEIRKTNGQEAVVLANGGSIEFIARSRGSGRGFTVDVLVCDEAQDLTDEELAALLPTISAAPLGNPQVILTGTPPDPDKPDRGEVFLRVRRDGMDRTDPRLCWVDFGVPDGPLPDVDDRSLWAAVNPALGGRLNIAEVERERGLMSPETFARERLGWWGDPAAERNWLPVGLWASLVDRKAKPVDPVAFALDMNPERTMAAIAVAWRGESGWHGEITQRKGVIDHRPGADWVPARLLQLVDERKPCAVLIDPSSPAGSLIPAFEAAGLRVTTEPRRGTREVLVKVTAGEMAQACGQFQDDPPHHIDQASLNAALAGASRRDRGDGAWTWSRKDSNVDIAPLVSVTLAVYGLSVHGTAGRRKPKFAFV